MHGMPPIWWESAVIRVNSFTSAAAHASGEDSRRYWLKSACLIVGAYALFCSTSLSSEL